MKNIARQELKDNGQTENDTFLADSLHSDSNTRRALEELVESFIEWKNKSLYLVLKKTTTEPIGRKYKIKTEQFGVWARKRGNSVYKKMVREKITALKSFIPDVNFFDANHNYVGQSSKILYAVLTYDTKRCSLEDAWKNIGREYNRFITSIRQRYGTVEIIRTWESFQNGYPHVNILLWFKNHSFTIARKDVKIKEGKKYQIFRILYSEKKTIASFWHSFVDVSACYNTYGVIDYISKYITKNLMSNKESSLLTMAMTWQYRKRVFSISKGFTDLITTVHNSNKNCQLNLFFKNVVGVKWYFVGLVSFSFIKKHIDIKQELLRISFGEKLPDFLTEEFACRREWESLTKRKWSSYRSCKEEVFYDE
jgi:hypothetical protein